MSDENDLKGDVNNQGKCIVDHETRTQNLESVLKEYFEFME